MLTGKEDLLQALVEAFIMEKGTKEFYTQASSKSTSSSAKKTFDELARWETTHMAYIQSLYQSIMDDRELMEFQEFSKHVPSPTAEGGILTATLAKRVESYSVKDERDALAIALSIEAKSYALYRELANKTHDQEAKVIFEEMMNQETKHLDHLNTLRKSISI